MSLPLPASPQPILPALHPLPHPTRLPPTTLPTLPITHHHPVLNLSAARYKVYRSPASPCASSDGEKDPLSSQSLGVSDRQASRLRPVILSRPRGKKRGRDTSPSGAEDGPEESSNNEKGMVSDDPAIAPSPKSAFDGWRKSAEERDGRSESETDSPSRPLIPNNRLADRGAVARLRRESGSSASHRSTADSPAGGIGSSPLAGKEIRVKFDGLDLGVPAAPAFGVLSGQRRKSGLRERTTAHSGFGTGVVVEQTQHQHQEQQVTTRSMAASADEQASPVSPRGTRTERMKRLKSTRSASPTPPASPSGPSTSGSTFHSSTHTSDHIKLARPSLPSSIASYPGPQAHAPSITAPPRPHPLSSVSRSSSAQGSSLRRTSTDAQSPLPLRRLRLSLEGSVKGRPGERGDAEAEGTELHKVFELGYGRAKGRGIGGGGRIRAAGVSAGTGIKVAGRTTRLRDSISHGAGDEDVVGRQQMLGGASQEENGNADAMDIE